MQISKGFSDADRPALAALYWEAFGPKLGAALGPRELALTFLAGVLDPTHAYVARSATGSVIGLAGYRTSDGALVAGRFQDMAGVYGPVGALWRCGLLGLLARDTDNVRFLLDGLAVAEGMRGHGIGSRLLEAIAAEAAARGYAEVRLDVVTENARARALYERRGFRMIEEQSSGLLGAIFGFRAATVMVRRLA